MKRISIVLGFIAALFTMVSCQKDQNFIRASITPYHGDEKVHLNRTNYACWDGDEYIWINENVYQIQAISGDNEHFLIDMGTNKPAHEGDKLYAVFHSSAISNYNNDADDADDDGIIEPTIDVTLPPTQTYTEDGHGNQVINAPMVATAEINSRGGADLIFSNVCALLKVQLQPNVICYYIEVTSNNAPLNGTGTIDITGKKLTMPSTGTTETRKVTLTVNTESNLANPKCRADGVYYIVLPPYMNSNLTVTVYDNPKTLMTFEQNDNGGHTLNASEIGVIDVNTLDAGRGLFSVDNNGTLVSFAPGNLTGTNSYSFTSSQETVGNVYNYDVDNINTYSSAMGTQWTLLTGLQWAHVLCRKDANGVLLQSRCSINGQHGLILYPDTWSEANGYPARFIDYQFNSNNAKWQDISNDWPVYQSYGAVFLPSQPGNNDQKKRYWTSTPSDVVIFGNGDGLPNGGLGIVATTESSHNNTDQLNKIEYNSSVTIPDGLIRLAHIVYQGSSNSSAK